MSTYGKIFYFTEEGREGERTDYLWMKLLNFVARTVSRFENTTFEFALLNFYSDLSAETLIWRSILLQRGKISRISDAFFLLSRSKLCMQEPIFNPGFAWIFRYSESEISGNERIMSRSQIVIARFPQKRQNVNGKKIINDFASIQPALARYPKQHTYSERKTVPLFPFS